MVVIKGHWVVAGVEICQRVRRVQVVVVVFVLVSTFGAEAGVNTEFHFADVAENIVGEGPVRRGAEFLVDCCGQAGCSPKRG